MNPMVVANPLGQVVRPPMANSLTKYVGPHFFVGEFSILVLSVSQLRWHTELEKLSWQGGATKPDFDKRSLVSHPVQNDPRRPTAD